MISYLHTPTNVCVVTLRRGQCPVMRVQTIPFGVILFFTEILTSSLVSAKFPFYVSALWLAYRNSV